MDSRYLYAGIIVILFAFIIFTYICFKLCHCQQPKDGEKEEAEEPFLKKPRKTNSDIERPHDRKQQQHTPIPDTEPECIQDEANHMPNLDYDKQNGSTLIYDQKAPLLPKEPQAAKPTNCKLKLVLSFKKQERMLTLTLDEISGISNKRSGGYNAVRIAMTLLPEKKEKRNTGMELVGDNGLVNLQHYTYKFPSLKHEDLVTSALRFRLYAKITDVLEVSFGQLFVHLYELSTHPGKLVVCKEFTQQQNVKLKYLE